MRPLKPRRCLALLGSMILVAACGRTDLDFAAGERRDDAGLSSGGRTATGGGGGRDVDGSGGRGGVAGRDGGTGGIVGTGGLRGTGGGAATGGSSGSGGTRGSGGTNGSGGTSGTGAADGGARDAALDHRPPDAAPSDAPGPDLPPPTPGTLMCGAESCDTATQSCCVSIAVGSVGARCIPAGASCGGILLGCDEPADCAGGTCCFGVQAQQGAGSSVALGSRCATRAACNGAGRYVVCRTDADCDRATPSCCSSALGVPVCQRGCP